MIGRVGVLLTRAKDILQTEGLKPLLRRGFDFVRAPLFQYGNYYLYLYQHTLKGRDEADFMPRIQGFTFRMVRTNEEADELAVTMGCDFRRCFVDARKSLDKGAIAFCLFVKGEIAHIGWVALSEEAKRVIEYLPYKVDFSNNEACTGGTITIPKYRGKGLMKYGYFKRFQFLREKGIIASRNAVAVNNIASQKAHAKFGPKIYARACYLKILWWDFWKERPMP
jgi:hypothetical protein